MKTTGRVGNGRLENKLFFLVAIFLFHAATVSSGCVITNETQPFRVLSLARESNDAITIVWESCSDHVYSVRTTEELSFTNVWTARAWMVGQDGSTSWTDTNAPS